MSGRWWAARVVGTGFLLAAAAVVPAFPPFLNEFKKTYSAPSGSPLANARCQTCHTTSSGGDRNVYGKSVEAKLEAPGATGLTAAIFKELEEQDADGDGTPNRAEIAAGTLPGDPKSKPAAATAATNAPAPSPTAEPVPKHSFHPLIVHFPIGLFLFGALLEALGVRKRNDSLRLAAKWNMAAGALSGVASMVTGLVASFRLGYALQAGTPVFSHLVAGLLATALMLAVAGVRMRKAPSGPGYLTLLALAVALVVAAGHYGGSLVYT